MVCTTLLILAHSIKPLSKIFNYYANNFKNHRCPPRLNTNGAIYTDFQTGLDQDPDLANIVVVCMKHVSDSHVQYLPRKGVHAEGALSFARALYTLLQFFSYGSGLGGSELVCRVERLIDKTGINPTSLRAFKCARFEIMCCHYCMSQCNTPVWMQHMFLNAFNIRIKITSSITLE